jgi:hypothetical protein
MAVEVLSLAKIFVGSYDLTARINNASLNHNINLLDDTAFGATARSRIAGLTSADLTLGGFLELGTGYSESVIANNIAVADRIITICPTASGAIGNPAYTMKSLQGEYNPGAKIGELYSFTMGAYSSGSRPLIRGTVMENSAKTTSTSGTGRQLGAVTSGKQLYAIMHITAVSGTNPTLDVIVESDNNSGFTSAQTRISFTQATEITSEWKEYSYSAANTDDYWRASWTIGGTDNPSFTVAIIFGIQ